MAVEQSAGANVVIRNVSGGDYAVAELGGVIIADDATLDLMDHYDNWDAARALVMTANPSQLWADIQAGDVEVVSTAAPTAPNVGGPG